jgi:tripartite-type tricarboxylate transporter receptor subunit TctC
MRLRRRQFLHLVAGAAALPAASRIASAQTYPTKPVRLIVGTPAGGPSDITARVMGQWLSERFGQAFIIDNRPGAATNVGTEAVVKAPPDGYTLLEVTTSNAISATLYHKLNFNFIRDIAPVASIMRVPGVMVVNPSFPSKTVAEFIAYARANPDKINMASAGIGSTQHVYGELFKAMVGVKMLHVPYRGEATRHDRSHQRAGAGDVWYFARFDFVHRGRQCSSARGDHRDAFGCAAGHPGAGRFPAGL